MGKEKCYLCPDLRFIIYSDLYEIIQHPPLILPDHYDPASYPSGDPFTIERRSTIDDVCDFVVEYINSDVVVRQYWVSVSCSIAQMDCRGWYPTSTLLLQVSFYSTRIKHPSLSCSPQIKLAYVVSPKVCRTRT
jgi:hypothetical protein